MDPGSGNHGFRTFEKTKAAGAAENLVQSTTIDSLMRNAGWSSLDLLKVDIEGSEKAVFDSASPWIARTNAIMAELHEDLQPGCSASFARATTEFIDGGKCGESILVVRKHSCN